MRRIPLTRGQFALVDDADYDWLSQWKWHAVWDRDLKSYYAARHATLPDGRSTSVRMHRQILGLEYGDKRQGDHINHDTLDQRRCNLRIVTACENHWNRKAAKGYYYNKESGKYMARIMAAGDHKFLGFFDTPTEARAAYLTAKAQYHRIGA
jgi:hypothetical protein